ncbi:hypothetical protein LMIY3S_00025 [Labrys miyagiensis]
MTSHSRKGSFASRPVDAESWIRTPEASPTRNSSAAFTARLTIDITPELRGRIKVVAFRRGITVADMLRNMLADAFPGDGEGS